VIEYLDQFCDVFPFLSEYEPLPNVLIVNAATVYHYPDCSGELFILLFHQVLYVGNQVEASLLCPNQMRVHGVVVDNCPIHLSPNCSSTHSIYVPEHDLRIPLQLDGIVSHIDTFCPSDGNLEHGTWVEMTLLTDWDPYSWDFLWQEAKAMSEDGGSFCHLVNSVGTHQALSDVVLLSVLPLLTPELLVEELDSRVAQIRRRIGDSLKEDELDVFDNGGKPNPAGLWDEDDNTDICNDEKHQPVKPEAEMPEADCWDSDAFDQYLLAELIIPRGDGFESGKVVARKRDSNGNPVGRSDQNPLLDTCIYEVEFVNGHVEEFAENVIAECMYSQIDAKGQQQQLLQDIVDHQKGPDTVTIKDGFVVSSNGNLVKRQTTQGWDICVEWKDQYTSWESLNDLKETYPVQLAEYAVMNGIDSEPAFAWWVKDVLLRREQILSKVKSRYWRTTHKFDIHLPKTVEEALRIDAETNTTFWRDAIAKEMKNVRPAFEIIEGDAKLPPGYKEIPCHMVYDVKMDFTRKAWFVAGGHVTDPPSTLTYSSVVSRESIHIASLIAALNDLQVCAVDVGNAYLNSKMREKVYTICGKEFGSYEGKRAIIVCALYGLKSGECAASTR